MVGRLLSLALAAVGAMATLVEKDVTVAQSGNTLTINGVSTGEIIIIQTNQGGGAQWTNVNPAIATGGQTHVVTVGGSTLTYNPSSIQAAVGDIVEFHYLAKNHSTTQSSFANPCVNAHQFDTGFMPNPTGMDPPPAIRVQVNTTSPTWFYCRQKEPVVHCGKGMVFSINPLTTGKTADAFKALAIAQNGTTNAAAASGAAPPPPAATSASGSSATTAAATSSASVASGTGSVDSEGECSCSCLCGAGSFGQLNTQSLGAFGGFGGMLTPGPNGA